MAGALTTILDGLSSGPDRAEGKEKTLLAWLDRIEVEGKQFRDASDGNKWEQYVNLYSGVRWSDVRTNPKFLSNVIRPTIDRRNAMLTENKPNAKILPWRDGLTATAEILEQLFDADWHSTGMALGIEEMVQLGAVIGSSGIDLAWNPGARFGEGEIDPAVLDPRQVVFDPIVRKARLLDKAMYLRVQSVRNIWDLQNSYPSRGMLVQPDRSVSTISAAETQGSNVLQKISTSFTSRIQKLEQGPIPRKIVNEYWVRDPAKKGTGQPKFPRGRHIIRAGDVILEDAENPYWDGLWPVEWFDTKSDIDTPWGRSEVEALRYISDAINRIGNQFVENTILGGNLVIITDADAMSTETRNRLTNAAALIVPKKFGRSIEYRPPPPMPPHMLQFVQWALRFVDYLVGLNDGQMEGKGRVELRSGVQLDGLQNAAQILVKASARRLEAFLERLGQKWISRVLQFYTGNRLLYYLGNDNASFQKYSFSYSQLQDEFVKILREQNHATTKAESLKDMMQTAWRSFAFKIIPFSSLAATRVARTQLLAQLVEQGTLPRSMLLKEIGFNNSGDLLKEAQSETQQYGPVQPAKKGKK